jgi:hypothetical protein
VVTEIPRASCMRKLLVILNAMLRDGTPMAHGTLDLTAKDSR